MGYHATVCLDFNHFELTIYNKTTTKLNFSLLKTEQQKEIENDEQDDKSCRQRTLASRLPSNTIGDST